MFRVDDSPKKAMKSAFLKLMDKDPANDRMAQAEIARLAANMPDAEIQAAYDSAHKKAEKQNKFDYTWGKARKADRFHDEKRPKYANLDSGVAQATLAAAGSMNDWKTAYPAVPQGLWGSFAV